MKYFKTLLFASIFLIFGCDNSQKTFTGYIVHKEYIPEHYDNETPKEISYAGVIIPPRPVVLPPRKPELVKSKWYWYVANKHRVKRFERDSLNFNKYFCGDKISIKY